MDRPYRYARWRTDCTLHCAQTKTISMKPRLTMRVDVRVQRAAIPNFVLKPQFTAQAGVLSNDRRVSFAGQVTSNAAKWESEKKDSSIYDFSTYAEGEEGVRLLIRNGFDGMDLWLVSKGRQGERHPLRIHGNGERIKSQDRYGPFWSGVPIAPQ